MLEGEGGRSEVAGTTPRGPLIVDDVSVSRGGRRILEGVHLSLHPGELCALIGPSGAGKSSLIRLLLGLWIPKSGRVAIGGGAVEDAGPLGYVPQDDALHGRLRVGQELRYAAELRMPAATREERERRVDEVLESVGLTEHARARIRRLSGGQRKRVAVALELLTFPPLLVLDEPTSGLDPGLESQLMTLFADVADGGRIVLVATHAMDSLERADALCVLVGGHVAYFGPPSGALDFFRVERYADLFGQLEKQEPSAWHLSARADGTQRWFRDRPGPLRALADRGLRGSDVSPSEGGHP